MASLILSASLSTIMDYQTVPRRNVQCYSVTSVPPQTAPVVRFARSETFSMRAVRVCNTFSTLHHEFKLLRKQQTT